MVKNMAIKRICELCGKESQINETTFHRDIKIEIHSYDTLDDYFEVEVCAECCSSLLNDIKTVLERHKRIYGNFNMSMRENDRCTSGQTTI